MATAPPSSVLVFCLMTTTLGLLLPQYCMGLDNILYTDDTLNAGESLVYGSYVFTMQRDCNLVVYDRSQPVWATHTNGKGSRCKLRMQEDGNLVVYDDNQHAVWASNTQGEKGNYICVLQRDRNVVVYGPALWATGTNNVGTPGVIISTNATKAAASTDGVVNAAAGYVVLDSAAAAEPINRKITMVTTK